MSDAYIQALQAELDSATRSLSINIANAMYGDSISAEDLMKPVPWWRRTMRGMRYKWYSIRYWLATSILRVSPCDLEE